MRSFSKTNYEIDMCRGPLLGKMLIFTLPLMLTGMFQLLYNATNIIIVGQFVGKQALSAVGSTGSLTTLMVNVFIGLSIGTSVAVSKYYGSNDYMGIKETVHTSITIAALSGVFIGIVGIILARPLLQLMDTPADVIDSAVLYMRILFIGMPANMIYAFGSAILRSVGDTRRPLYFLTISGVVNVLLNLLLVVGFKMSVGGVATATITAQYISMILIVRCLMVSNGAIRLNLKQLGIKKDKLLLISRIGLPAGIQGSLFSISNVLIQSSINSFGSVAIAGNAAASNLEGFVYIAMNTIYQTNITFTSQNMGAKQYKRVRKILWICIGIVSFVGITMGGAFVLFAKPLLSLYNSDAEVIAFGVIRMTYICLPYLLCGIMEVLVGQMRGIGYSIIPMLVSLTGACLFRIVWVYTVFEHYRTLEVLFISYPVSWALTAAIHLLCYLIVRRKLPKDNVTLDVVGTAPV